MSSESLKEAGSGQRPAPLVFSHGRVFQPPSAQEALVTVGSLRVDADGEFSRVKDRELHILRAFLITCAHISPSEDSFPRFSKHKPILNFVRLNESTYSKLDTEVFRPAGFAQTGARTAGLRRRVSR